MGYDASKFEVQCLEVQIAPNLYMTHIKVRRRDGLDGISWDELQEIKNEVAGFGAWAIEVYPAADQLVNEENIRHLWVVPWDYPLPNLKW